MARAADQSVLKSRWSHASGDALCLLGVFFSSCLVSVVYVPFAVDVQCVEQCATL